MRDYQKWPQYTQQLMNDFSHYQRLANQKEPTTMRNVLSVYAPPLPEEDVAAVELTAEVCLKLTPRDGKVLLEIVDPDTGEHVTSGNLLNIYPDGTFIIIPGAVFGDNEKRGFKNRNPS